MDQPLKALDILKKAEEENISEIYFTLYKARILEMISEYDKSISLYKNILVQDTCNFESLACIGSHYFYSDHPEVALKYYKRLFELGINSAEVWNNMGLCAFYSGQYDFCLSCFERGLFISDENLTADIWYNISHVAICIGDIELASYSLKVTLQYNKNHFEAQNNLGVLELRKGDNKKAFSNFEIACNETDFAFEPYYNYAVSNYRLGNLEKALNCINKSLEIFPEHFDSFELRQAILKELAS
jgi:tetratricopeptide repeat protein 8